MTSGALCSHLYRPVEYMDDYWSAAARNQSQLPQNPLISQTGHYCRLMDQLYVILLFGNVGL